MKRGEIKLTKELARRLLKRLSIEENLKSRWLVMKQRLRQSLKGIKTGNRRFFISLLGYSLFLRFLLFAVASISRLFLESQTLWMDVALKLLAFSEWSH